MACDNLFNKIDELYIEYVSIWEDVCNIESPTDYKKGVDEVGAYFIRLAEKFGWKIEVLEQKISGNAICITITKAAIFQIKKVIPNHFFILSNNSFNCSI